MLNLLTRYIDNPTDANALKLRAYDHKHPMARCLIPAVHLALFASAIHQAGFVLQMTARLDAFFAAIPNLDDYLYANSVCDIANAAGTTPDAILAWLETYKAA